MYNADQLFIALGNEPLLSERLLFRRQGELYSLFHLLMGIIGKRP
jgi:hypothetical protein